MGLIYTKISLRNPREPESVAMQVRALADTGSMHLCIPEHFAVQLKLTTLYEREVITADGSKKLCAYVGPIEVGFNGRACFTGALVLGEEVLLGAVPMEDMDLVINPATRNVTPNPKSPNIPSSRA